MRRRDVGDPQIDKLLAEHQQFVYHVAHDIRAPLRHIDTFTKLVLERETTLREESNNDLKIVLDCVQKARSLLDDVLAYSRIQSQAYKPKSVDANELVNRVFSDVREDEGATDATLILEPLPTIYGDPDQLETLFFHLLQNALKFRRPEAAPTIRIDSKLGKGFVHIHVCDNGIGLDAKFHEDAFSFFLKAVSSDYPGNGAGLAIAKCIVDRHQGRIAMASQKDNEGLCVTVSLPFKQDISEPSSPN